MPSIYLRAGDSLVEMTEQPYEAESVLQQLIAQFPRLLTNGAADADGALLLVEREVGVTDQADGANRWSLDHLFLDREAVPTLVEVKRRSDTRIRREVIGQLLEYAANAAAYWDVTRLRAVYEERFDDISRGHEQLCEFLGLSAAEAPDDIVDGYWERVDSNLQAGRLRLVIVADEIPRELQRIVEFLNEQMQRTEVIAIEVRQFVDPTGAHQTLVPKVIGDTGRAQQAKSDGAGRRRNQIDESALFAALYDQQEPEIAARAERLYRALHPHADQVKRSSASVTLWLGVGSDPLRANPLSVGFWANGSEAGGVSVNFVHFVDKRADGQVRALADSLAEIPGMRPLVNALEAKSYRSWLTVGPALERDDSTDLLVQILIAGATRR